MDKIPCNLIIKHILAYPDIISFWLIICDNYIQEAWMNERIWMCLGERLPNIRIKDFF